MKRKVVYSVAGVSLVALIMGARLYQKAETDSSGYLGAEVIYFQDASSLQEEEAPDTDYEPEETPLAETAEPEPEETAVPGETIDPDGMTELEEQDVLPDASMALANENYGKILSNASVQVYNSTGTVVVGDSAYELYNYVDSAASRYAKAINKLTQKLGSNVTVYDLVAPTSVGITFPDNKRKKINSSDQQEALNNIERKLSGRERFVPLYDVMMQHRMEYIYFRTDHHWTSLGAYYAYQAFCEAKGIMANPLTAYQRKVVKGFLGSFYRETNENKNLKIDSLEEYYPVSNENLTMTYTTISGQKITAPVVADAKNYGTSLKYIAFIAGDNPYTVIQNKEKNDNSSCVVVKESYGNALVPYLADHYQTVYVIDYRYWEGKLCNFIKKKKSRDVILINNISMTRNSYLIGKLTQIVS